jgi:hypothetical protein
MVHSFKPQAVGPWLVNLMGKGGRGHGGHHPSPNDQRSNAKNPTSHEYAAAVDNRSAQLNPTSPEYKGPAPSKDNDQGSSDD